MFPGMMAPLSLDREEDMAAVDEALVQSRMVLACARMPGADEDSSPGNEDIYRFGTTCQVLKKIAVPDGSQRVLLQGTQRGSVKRWVQTEPYFLAEVEIIEPPVEEGEEDNELEALQRHVLGQFQRVVELSQIPEEAYLTAMNVDTGGKLADVVAANMNLPVSSRQLILETTDPKERLREVSEMIQSEIAVLELRDKLRTEARGEMERAQRQFYLRQQLDAIKKELGEGNEQEQELNELRESIEKSAMPEEAERAALREIDRLSRMAPASAEYSVGRTWIDWLIRYPWATTTDDDIDLEQAQEVLDEDHYDLEKIKERIVEYLAVMQLNPGQQGPILCFVGPPGVGKTSLGMSIARALGRKFVRMSLGGMRDEAEIRGHRRTYIGALPGRIVQGMCQAESNNPVFMLDEVDKIGMDFRGDPASALLEVLDPAQNDSFRDLYLDVDVDLSKVMFVTTANVLDPIPSALRDRMEVLQLSGYTLNEKVAIAHRHLIPQQMEEHGLPSSSLRWRKTGLEALISGYTRESGVRNLDRQVASVCRKRARLYVAGEHGPVSVMPDRIGEWLGPAKFTQETVARHKTPGVVAGLAWTPTGGEVLFVEGALITPGKGLTLTGSLGDVMKESARAAMTCVRTRAEKLDLDATALGESELHIHVPEGSIPKDGPSAGITMAVAIASLLSGRPARHNVAMTGEITLQGRVLRIGGLKEKVLAASRAGIKTVLLPKENEADLEDVPEDVREKLEFIPIEWIDEAAEVALSGRRRSAAKKKSSGGKKSAGKKKSKTK
ncbi:MAG: endopeptidase La [Armatimonadia bacterium]|nr:endopeptidase La [Armatimonadia bacterium]